MKTKKQTPKQTPKQTETPPKRVDCVVKVPVLTLTATLLNNLDNQRRKDCVVNLGGEQPILGGAADDTPAVFECEATILTYLNGEYPQLRTITEAHEATNLDRKTIRGYLHTLGDKGLVSAQRGKKSTLYVITPKGRDYISQYFS
jgi:predicted transcriptional regulator